MKLKYLLQKNAWFIEHERGLYCLANDDDMFLAASTLPLVVVDADASIAQPHIAGMATLQSRDPSLRQSLLSLGKERAQVRIQLAEPDGRLVADESLTLDEATLSSVEWLTHPFDDGWLEADASVVLDNVRELELNAFLPTVPDSEGKALTVHNETAGTSREIWLERDKNNCVPLVQEGSTGRVVLRLECEPEPNDEERDVRRLGFVLAGENLRAA